MSEQHVLTIRNVEKSYADFQLGPVECSLEAGYVYAVMGENGSGKSTLFRLLNGIVQPEQGSISWFGGRYGCLDIEVKLRVAYVPDELDIPDESWTLAKWKAFNSRWYPQWNGRKYRQLVERYGVPENKPMSKCSKGTRGKAAFIMALSQEPEVLLLDEMSSGLDPFAWRMMMEDLNEYMASGNRTILMATHVLDEIKRLGDYVFFLQGGQMYGSYEKDTLQDEWRMLWVDRLPHTVQSVPGVVAVEDHLPVRLVTNRVYDTESALADMGITVTESRRLELDEIFLHVIRMKANNPNRRES